jgi:hypothetical protein
LCCTHRACRSSKWQELEVVLEALAFGAAHAVVSDSSSK